MPAARKIHRASSEPSSCGLSCICSHSKSITPDQGKADDQKQTQKAKQSVILTGGNDRQKFPGHSKTSNAGAELLIT
jgi:hypothetical protein